MKKTKFILLIVMVICSSMTFAQDCKVPTSFLVRGDINQTTDGLGGDRGYNDVILTRQKRDHFVDSCGFSDDIENTRYAICLNSITGPRSVQLRVSLTDTEKESVLYSILLDTCYADEDARYLFHRMYKDLHLGVIPQYLRVLDTIRANIIAVNEGNTPRLMKEVLQLFAANDIENAMFKLAQYPACCPSWPKVRPFIVALFREYVKRDHSMLLHEANLAWENCENETEARFVVSLLNSEQLSKSERKKADKMLKKVAKEYPALDINAHEDYTGTPELADIAVKMAYKIGVRYGSLHAPETRNIIPAS